MKRVGFLVSLMMCLTLSLCLPIVGVIQSGGFKLGMYLLNFTLSFVISFLITMLFPAMKLNLMLEKKFGLKFGSLKTRLVETFISDLIYTPILTVIMASLAWYSMKKAGEETPPYLMMILVSSLISFVVAYIIILVTVPLYLKLSMKMCGITMDRKKHEKQ